MNIQRKIMKLFEGTKYTKKENNRVKITKSSFSCVRDGLIIRGEEYRPRGENLPIAIVSHGFMANMGTVKRYAQLLARMGYVAFCFDFNGGCVALGKSDGKTTDMSVLTEVKDLCAVIDYTRKLSYTDTENVLLMGCSQGGFVSAISAAQLKNLISKLVLFFPALCIPDDARSGQMMWAKFDPNNIPEIVECGPMKLGRCYVADVIEMDPFEEIKGYEGDVLIVHGTADKIVNIKYAERAVAVYENEPYKRNVSYHVIENGEHSFSKKQDKIAMEHVKEFAQIK